MRDNIMITFANQKGGVGKTTLCTMFADYLAAKGESVLVVDFDRQQTIYSKRKEDVEKYRGVRLPYTVQPFDIKDTNNVREFLTSLREGYKGIVLMDTPGNLSQQGLVPIFALSHYNFHQFHRYFHRLHRQAPTYAAHHEVPVRLRG